jgi:hypothetical protein
MCPIAKLNEGLRAKNRFFVIKEITFNINTRSQTSLNITEVTMKKYVRIQVPSMLKIISLLFYSNYPLHVPVVRPSSGGNMYIGNYVYIFA